MSETISLARGEHKVFSLTPTEDVSAATSLIFTAKRYLYQPDSEAQFQHSLGNGIVVSNGTIQLTVVHADTSSLNDATSLFCDVSAGWADRAPVVVWEGVLEVSLTATQELDTSLTIHTTEPGATESAITAKIAAEAAATLADQKAARTAADALSTAADRVATGQDRTQTGLDRSAVASDLSSVTTLAQQVSDNASAVAGNTATVSSLAAQVTNDSATVSTNKDAAVAAQTTSEEIADALIDMANRFYVATGGTL
jgi:hypothetical protein